MSSQDETLKIVAEVVDKFSGPLKDLRKQLQDTGGKGGNAQNKQLERSYEDIRKSVRGLRDEVKGGLTPALAVFGLTAFSVGGAMVAVASSLKNFVSSTNTLSMMRRETGLTIDTMRQFESYAARMGSTPDAMRAGFSAFATNMQELRRGVGGTFGFLLSQRDAGMQTFIKDLRGITNNEEALKRVFKLLDTIQDPLERGKVLNALGLPPELGRLTGPEREAMFKSIAENIGRVTKEAEESFARFKKAVDGMGNAWDGFVNRLGSSGVLDSILEIGKFLNKQIIVPGVGEAKRPTAGFAEKAALDQKQSQLALIESAIARREKAGEDAKDLRSKRDLLAADIAELKRALEKATKEGASQGIQEGIRKMMLEGRPGGDFGGGARVIRASYGGGGGGGGGDRTGGGPGDGGGAVQAPPMGALGTRGDRNNNPGNMEYGPFAKAQGATGSDGRFAIFPTKEAGHAAMGALLKEKYQGLTLGQIGNKWANNPPASYQRGLEAATGLRSDQVPDLNDPLVRGRLMDGIKRGEGTGGNSLGEMVRRGAGGANFMKGQFGPPGSNITPIKTPLGKKVIGGVNQEAAPAFQGFLSDLEKAGAPFKSVGGYNRRKIAGSGTWSQHAYGNAIDIDQKSRDVVSRDFGEWARANKDKLREMQQRWGITSGGDWKNPDFGHFEWNGKQPWLDQNREAERNRLFDSAANSGVLGGTPNLDGNAKLQIELNGFRLCCRLERTPTTTDHRYFK